VQVGIVAALHTWDDRLLRHPHLHCLVTGGGLTPEDAWKDSYKPGDRPFLVSVKALMQRFRKLLCTKLKNALKKDKLTLPQGWGTQQMFNLINKVNRSAWQVYIAKAPETGGPTTEEILAYQAKAVAGGPLSAMRIEGIKRKVAGWMEGIQADQEPQLRYVSEAPLTSNRVQGVSPQAVTFRWGTYDPETGRRVRNKSKTLPLENFIQRLLWHVLPPDFRAIRQYGLYTSVKQAAYEQCRALLPPSPAADSERSGTFGTTKQDDDDGRVPREEYLQQRKHCPVCGKQLEITRIIPSSVTGKISPRDKQRLPTLRRARRRGS
jgi:predicted nucleic acid-binding Zn ribbon protein